MVVMGCALTRALSWLWFGPRGRSGWFRDAGRAVPVIIVRCALFRTLRGFGLSSRRGTWLRDTWWAVPVVVMRCASFLWLLLPSSW